MDQRDGSLLKITILKRTVIVPQLTFTTNADNAGLVIKIGLVW